MAVSSAGDGVLRMVAAVDWSAYAMPPSAQWYEPEHVPAAFKRLVGVGSEQQGMAAYHAMLFAVGNDHAGVLYPAAAAAAPFLVRVVRECDGWPRRAALEILTEFCYFEADREQFVDPSGRLVHTKEAIVAVIRSLRGDLERMAVQTHKCSVPSAQSARGLLECLDEECRDMVAIDLTEVERDFMCTALGEWGGSASFVPLPVSLVGADSWAAFDELTKRLRHAIKNAQPISGNDWARALFLSELSFGSDIVGAGVDFSTASGFTDEEAIRVLRSLQRKIITVHPGRRLFPGQARPRP
jgi:hypothetical protein